MSRNNNFRGNRKGGRNGTEKKSIAIDESNPVLISFQRYAEELDTKHDRYERIFKHSRDITIESKRIIFLLHTIDSRYNPDNEHRSDYYYCYNSNLIKQFFFRKSNNEEILSNAHIRLMALCKDNFVHIAKELHNTDPYQFGRAFSAGLQEFIEAFTFYEYQSGKAFSNWDSIQEMLTFHKLPEEYNEKKTEGGQTDDDKVEEMQEEIKQITVNDTQQSSDGRPIYKCLVQPMEFMLGLGDLGGEVMRQCVNSLGSGDFDTCFQACNFLRHLYTK